MDFKLTEEQGMFQRMIRDFAEKEIVPLASEIDETEEFPFELIKKMADLGLFGITIPEEYGGSGGDFITLEIAGEEIARASGAVWAIHLGHLSLTVRPLLNFATEEQKRKYIVPAAKGEKLACFALTEEGAGSDAGAITTTAKFQGNGYLLNGMKMFITNGDEADFAWVFATVDRSLGHRGICSFVVEKPNFSVIKKERKLGIRGSSTAQLLFEDSYVPAENLVGEKGRGLRTALESIDMSRISVASQAIGIAQASFDAALKFSKERKQFGWLISEFQAIQWMLADMATSIEAARLLTYRAAFLMDQGLPFVKEAAMAKLFASEMSREVTNKALQIHGGYGYIKDYPLERYLRDARITEIYEGTSEMQRMTIERALLRE